jgi:hypothetical protein
LIVMTAVLAKEIFVVLAETGRDIAGLDIIAILDMATRIVAAADGPAFNTALTIVLVCWLLSIVDAYRIGRRLDLERHGWANK